MTKKSFYLSLLIRSCWISFKNCHSGKMSTFQCDFCRNGFAKKTHLEKHLRLSHFRVTGEGDAKALDVNKEKSLKSLKLDIRALTRKRKSFECDYCDEVFRRRRHLKEHVRVHIWLNQVNKIFLRNIKIPKTQRGCWWETLEDSWWRPPCGRDSSLYYLFL